MNSIFKYIENNNEVIITGLQEGVSDTSIVIPETIDGMPVTEIYGYAFCESPITDIKMGRNIRKIENNAFYRCKKLSSVTWNCKCNAIPAFGFYECTNLKQFNFTLKNKSGHTLKINWDDVSYVDVKGQVGRVMHSGVKYTDRNSSQPATTVPKGASISDILLPTENVYYVSGQYGGWRETYLVPCVYKTPEAFNAEAPSLVGKTMTVMMPIMIENVQNDYTFTFNIDKLLNEAK